MSEALEELRRRFEELEDLEREAYILYKKLLAYVTDEQDRKDLTGVMEDEAEHAKMAGNILEILKKEKSK